MATPMTQPQLVPIVLRSLIAGALGGLCLAASPVGEPPSTSPTPATGVSSSLPPTAALIVAPLLLPDPAQGKGRMTIVFSGNRRWCTFPDDRTVKPPEDPRKNPRASKKNQVFTFGYKFTISAVKRGADDQALMLFESPLFRTAYLRQAAKTGRPTASAPSFVGPGVGSRPLTGTASPKDSPAALVPYWEEQYRCTTLPERFDFDLDPGTYDIYAAFDIMGPQGGWTHRTSGYLTDVTVEPGRRTRLDGIANMGGIAERNLTLRSATLLPEEDGRGAGGP